MPTPLESLFRYLDALQSRPPLAELRERLARLSVSADDLADLVRFSDRAYQRKLVRAGAWYNVWVMCWRNGQRSPVHDHAASACAVRVLRGTLTDTRFTFAPNGAVKALGSCDVEAGGICAAQDADLHQIANLQAGNADLVTLHIYTPPLVRMGTFSLIDAGRGEDVCHEEPSTISAAGPENSETPLASIHGWVTPNRLFFVRNHFEQPQMDLASYRLRVEGAVERPYELTWEELSALPHRSLCATAECASNTRSFLQAPVPGMP